MLFFPDKEKKPHAGIILQVYFDDTERVRLPGHL